MMIYPKILIKTNFGKGPHKRLVVLHSSSGVDKDDVEIVVFGYIRGLAYNPTVH